jgi:aryl-alcohol dehydrogenase-like predicted oxidoreductase
MEALHDVVKAGKARYLGASSMWAWQFAKAQSTAERHGWTPFVSMQDHYNLLYREEERRCCRCAPTRASGSSRGARSRAAPRTCLGRGHRALGDRRLRHDPLRRVRPHDRRAGGRGRRRAGVSRAQVALAWLLAQPVVTAPIVGATKVSHLEDAVAAVDLRLDDAAVARLEEPYAPHAVVGF